MNKSELKLNISKINKLFRSENYEAGMEIIETYNDLSINKGVSKTMINVLKQKFLRERNYDIIDKGIELLCFLGKYAMQQNYGRYNRNC